MRNILRNIGNEMSLMLRRPCAVITWLAMCFFVLWNFINNVNTAADHAVYVVKKRILSDDILSGLSGTSDSYVFF